MSEEANLNLDFLQVLCYKAELFKEQCVVVCLLLGKLERMS